MLVIKKVNLRADDSVRFKFFEKCVLLFGRPQFTRMPPEPQADLALFGISRQLANLLVTPARPEAFNHMMLEPEFSRPTAEILHVLERIRSAIEVFPDGAAGANPGSSVS